MAKLDIPRAKRAAVGSWCVWAKNGRKPSVWHPTREAAVAEANRLSGLNNGKKFVVMQVTDAAFVSALPEQPESATA